MKNLISFSGPIIAKIKHLIVTGLIFSILIPSISSCSRMLSIPGQGNHLSSAYTHSGKYEKKIAINKNHSGVKKYAVKCSISPAKK